MADEGLSLVGFLADLRSDLVLARQRAVSDAVANVADGGAALWLEVDEVTVTLEVEHAGKVSGKATAGVEGSFWVFAKATAGGEVAGESSQTGTQTLTLTLKPRFDEVVTNPDGTTTIKSTGVNIEGALTEGEQSPDELPSQ
jgi:hypothetical protein